MQPPGQPSNLLPAQFSNGHGSVAWPFSVGSGQIPVKNMLLF